MKDNMDSERTFRKTKGYDWEVLSLGLKQDNGTKSEKRKSWVPWKLQLTQIKLIHLEERNRGRGEDRRKNKVSCLSNCLVSKNQATWIQESPGPSHNTESSKKIPQHIHTYNLVPKYKSVASPVLKQLMLCFYAEGNTGWAEFTQDHPIDT